MTNSFKIGLSSWIIQDGNYPDFKRGERAAFAIEFFALTALSMAETQSPPITSIQNVEADHYRIVAKVVHVRDFDWWAIDAGILMYREEKPPDGIEPGRWVSGEVRLGVDPFFYFERLSRHHTAPALIYDWKIANIEIQTAPFMKTLEGIMVRDPAQLGWREITETDAWHDDQGLGEYVLHCERLDSAPRR